MNRNAFKMISYGFLFILVNFRIKGLDILPDTIGYVLFAAGFRSLASQSEYYRKALYVNIPLLITSLVNIYQFPASTPVQAGGVSFNFGALGVWAIPVCIANCVLSILVIYNMFQGIIEMALAKGLGDIADEAGRKWKEYLYLQIAVLFLFAAVFLPVIGIAYIIALAIISLIIILAIMRFMKVCGENL